MQPGSLVHAVREWVTSFSMMPETQSIWFVGTVVACRRTNRSSTPWVEEKTGEQRWEYPTDVGWQCTLLSEDRILELLLEDADEGKTWMEV